MADQLCREIPGGVLLAVRVVPRAGATRLAGVRDGRLLVRLAAAPVDNAANEALVSLFAKILKVPSSRIRVASGDRSRNKHVIITGVSVARVQEAVTTSSARS